MKFKFKKLTLKINWKELAIVVGIVFLTAGVIGGSMWLGMTDAVNMQNSQIDSLETQVSSLSKEIKKKSEEKWAQEEAEAKAAAEAAAAAKAAEEEAARKQQQSVPRSSQGQQQSQSAPEQPAPAPASQVYYFYSPYCGTCNAQTPIVNELQGEGVPFVFMNVIDHPEYISQYGISAVPTFICNEGRQTAFLFKAELLNFWNTYK